MTTDAIVIEQAVGTMRWLRWIAAAIAGWIGLVVMTTVWLEPVKTVIVIGPEPKTIAAIANTDAAIVDAGPGFTVVQGDSPGFVLRLYLGGAWLVLPRRVGGCIGRLP